MTRFSQRDYGASKAVDRIPLGLAVSLVVRGDREGKVCVIVKNGW